MLIKKSDDETMMIQVNFTENFQSKNLKLVHELNILFKQKSCTGIIMIDDKNFIMLNKFGK